MKPTKHVLLLTYYWPPSGGAGVQRWLKFVKYFDEFDVKCTVVTVDPKKASYPLVDESLSKEVSDSIEVHYTDTREILSVYKKTSSDKKIPHAGFANEKTSFLKNVARFIRGNFFIPDARKGWNKFAYAKASELLSTKDFDALIVTSPPHSTQLVGLKLKRKFNIPWIADMRDPWTDIYYYKKMLHTRWAKKKDASLERQVLKEADKIIVVSESIRQLFGQKVNRLEAITVLPNGFDQADFISRGKVNPVDDKITITYTGTISDAYPIDTFLTALREVGKEKFKLKFVGSLDPEIKTKLNEFDSEFPGYVEHGESINFLLSSDILLLVIPDIENNAGILTGKLFEYLGSQKTILAIGPIDGDAAKIIQKCEAGKVFDYSDLKSMTDFLHQLANGDHQSNWNEREVLKYSRKELTRNLVELL